MTFGSGKNAKTLSGEALYNHMKEHERKQLAGFLNMTAGLASITFKDGSRAIDYVKGVTGGTRERIYANVDPALKTQMETLSGKDYKAGMRFIGPTGQAVPHGNAGIDYDKTFRENILDGAMQLSFASKENFARMDTWMNIARIAAMKRPRLNTYWTAHVTSYPGLVALTRSTSTKCLRRAKSIQATTLRNKDEPCIV